MKAAYVSILCAAASLSVSSVAQAQDAPAQPMLNDPYFQRARTAEQQEIRPGVDQKAFKVAYDKAGRPKLVLLIGEPFSAMVSDWHMQRRVSVNAQATGTAGTDVPESQQLQVGAEQRVSQPSQRSNLLTNEQWDTYQRAYQGTLMKYGVRLVNRAVAMRLLDAEIRMTKNKNPQDDSQRLEMDMLRKHSKLILEVMPYRESKPDHEPIGYHITMTSLEDATLLADEQIAIPQGALEYKAGPGGYNLERPRQSTGVAAQAGGYEFVEAESDVWAEQGELAAQATVQLLYERYL